MIILEYFRSTPAVSESRYQPNLYDEEFLKSWKIKMQLTKFLKNRDKWSISGTRDKASKTGTVPAKTAQMEGLRIDHL